MKDDVIAIVRRDIRLADISRENARMCLGVSLAARFFAANKSPPSTEEPARMTNESLLAEPGR